MALALALLLALPVRAHDCADLSVPCLERVAATPGYESPPGAPSAPVSRGDQRRIDAYVDSRAYLLNGALRTGDRERVGRYGDEIRALNEALGRIPAYRGLVFRGSAHPPAASLNRGEVFTDPAFVSASRRVEIGEHYAGVKGYVSVIVSRSGRSLAYTKGTAELDSEAEVLFQTGTRFRILDAKPRADGVTVVFLEDLGRSPTSEAVSVLERLGAIRGGDGSLGIFGL